MKNETHLTKVATGALVLIAVSVFFLFQSIHLKGSSAYFPTFILSLIVLLSALLAVTEYIKNKKSETEQVNRSERLEQIKRVALSITLMATYIAMMKWIGFYVTTLIAIPLISYIFGYRERKKVAIGTVIYTVLLYVIFSQIMGREMPHGILM